MKVLSSAWHWVGKVLKRFRPRARMDGGDATRWLVQSESREWMEHLVDLLDYRLKDTADFNGSCTCERFVFDLKKQFEGDPREARRCKHILLARDTLTGALLTEEWERRNNGRRTEER